MTLDSHYDSNYKMFKNEIEMKISYVNLSQGTTAYNFYKNPNTKNNNQLIVLFCGFTNALILFKVK